MKRQWLFLIVGLAVALVAGAAQAADLNPSQIGTSCPEGTVGTWHFVNNQTGGAGAGTLTAAFSDTDGCVVGATTVLANTQHFFCVGEGATLLSASTNLPGRLVLSQLTCGTKEPPPCEGKNCPPPPK